MVAAGEVVLIAGEAGLNLNHLGAEISQQAGGIGAGQHPGEV